MTLDPNRTLIPAPLQSLSLTRDTRVPTPDERMAALKQYVGTQFANLMFVERFNQERK